MKGKIAITFLSVILILAVVATAKFGDRVPSSSVSSSIASPEKLPSPAKLTTKVTEEPKKDHVSTTTEPSVKDTRETQVSASYRVTEETNVPLPSSESTSTAKTTEAGSIDQDLIPAPSAPPQYQRRQDHGPLPPPGPPLPPPPPPGYGPYDHPYHPNHHYHGPPPPHVYAYHNEIPGSSAPSAPSPGYDVGPPPSEYGPHGPPSDYGPHSPPGGPSSFSPATPEFMRNLLHAFDTLQRRQQQQGQNQGQSQTNSADGSTSSPNYYTPSSTSGPQAKASDSFEKRSNTPFDGSVSSSPSSMDPDFAFDPFFRDGPEDNNNNNNNDGNERQFDGSGYHGPPPPPPPPPPPSFDSYGQGNNNNQQNNNRRNNRNNNQNRANSNRNSNRRPAQNNRRNDLNNQASNHNQGHRNNHNQGHRNNYNQDHGNDYNQDHRNNYNPDHRHNHNHGYLPRHDPHPGPHAGPNYGPSNYGPSNYGPSNYGPNPSDSYNSPTHGGNDGGPPGNPSSSYLPGGVPDPARDPRAKLIKEHVGAENAEGKPFGSKMTYSFRDPKQPNNFMEVTEVKMSMNKKYPNNGGDVPSAAGSSRSSSFPDFPSFPSSSFRGGPSDFFDPFIDGIPGF